MSWRPNYRPSNGTSGDMFRYGPQGCASCTVDHDQGWHTDEGQSDSCPILMVSIVGPDGPPEWEDRDRPDGKGWDTRCTAWRGPCSCTEGTTWRLPDWDNE